MNPELKKEDIKCFSERYKHSEEEQEDLIDFYEEHEGDITGILESIICSNNDDL
jgi:DnaJ family protein C protein 9